MLKKKDARVRLFLLDHHVCRYHEVCTQLNVRQISVPTIVAAGAVFCIDIPDT